MLCVPCQGFTPLYTPIAYIMQAWNSFQGWRWNPKAALRAKRARQERRCQGHLPLASERWTDLHAVDLSEVEEGRPHRPRNCLTTDYQTSSLSVIGSENRFQEHSSRTDTQRSRQHHLFGKIPRSPSVARSARMPLYDFSLILPPSRRPSADRPVNLSAARVKTAGISRAGCASVAIPHPRSRHTLPSLRWYMPCIATPSINPSVAAACGRAH